MYVCIVLVTCSFNHDGVPVPRQEWFFQLMVLHGDEDLWPSAEPMRQLEQMAPWKGQ